jgi:hypothetical protein
MPPHGFANVTLAPEPPLRPLALPLATDRIEEARFSRSPLDGARVSPGRMPPPAAPKLDPPPPAPYL